MINTIHMYIYQPNVIPTVNGYLNKTQKSLKFTNYSRGNIKQIL